MRRILTLSAIVTPDLALADVGHVSDIAGHSHWIALGALGIATIVGVLTSVKGKREEPEAEADAADSDDKDAQEAPA